MRDKACEVLTRHVNGCVAYTLESGALQMSDDVS